MNMRKILILIGFEITVFIFFIFLMKTDSIFLLVALCGVGLYAFRKAVTLREIILQTYSARRWLGHLIFIICIIFTPIILKDAYLIHLCIMAAIYSIIAMGLNFTLGSANMTHFASSAFFGIGAYTAALLSVHLHTGFWINIVLATLCASVFGFLQVIPVLKTKTYYLALVTMAYGLIFYQFVNTVKLTGGPAGLLGIPYPKVFGFEFVTPLNIFGMKLPFQANFFYLIIIFVIIAVICAQRLHNSWIGMIWNYIGEDEIAAQCQGINVGKVKLLAFALDGAYAGFAGAFYAHYITYIGPPNADIMISVIVVSMVIFGGMDNIYGVILGAALLTILPEKLRLFQDFRLMIYAVAVLFILIFRPSGLLPRKIRIHEGS